MKKFIEKWKNKYLNLDEVNILKRRRSYAVMLITAILLIFSIINMFSTSMYLIYKYKNGMGYVFSHIISILVSVIVGLIVSRIPYKLYNKKKVISTLFIGSLLTIFFVIVVGLYFAKPGNWASDLVPTINGSIGWIRIGRVSIQPVELIKIPFIIILAHIIDISMKKSYSIKETTISLIVVMAMFFIFIYWQHDLGTAIHYLSIFLFMLFLTDISLKLILSISIPCGLLGIFGIFYAYQSGILNSPNYKYGRILSFLKGLIYNEYDNKIGYQVRQSLLAFGNGGVIGKGFANGVQKYSYLPEVTTDFVMSSFGEEFGFLGLLVFIFLFFLLFVMIKNIAIRTEDTFGKFLTMGLGGMIMIQMIINFYVILGMLPVFGIPIPFFSYGGTSLLTVMIALGIILNINNSQNNK